MENSKIIRMPVSFIEEDVDHCFNCLIFSEYLLDSDTDSDSFSLSLSDIQYLSRLLCREYNLMCDVIKSSFSEGPDYVI